LRLISTIDVDIGLLRVWERTAGLFSSYSEEQAEDLKTFVRKHGQPLPIVVSEDMRVVDGYNRYRLYMRSGIKAVSVQVYAYENDTEMEVHAIALNAKRRHLDAVQCARAARRLALLCKPTPAETKLKRIEAGKKGGRGHKRCTQEFALSLKNNRRPSILEKSARTVGVAVSTVKMVAKVDESNDSLLLEKMESGQISVAKAFELSFLPPAERKKRLKGTIAEAEKQLAQAVGRIKYLHGDCREVLKTLDDKSVFTCVTSPPYWNIRHFGIDDGIGMEPSPEAYVESMVKIFREVRRVLKNEGTLWINVGDAYAGSRGFTVDGRGTQMPDDLDYDAEAAGNRKSLSKKLVGYKARDLIGVPWMLAFALRQDGWYLRSDIIWHKPNCFPRGVKSRPVQCHEYIFLLSKSPKYYYDYKAVQEKTICSETNEYRHKRSVWLVPQMPFIGEHTASFPEKLVEPCILAGCPPKGWILDPFAGAGTTAIVAQRLNRNCILIDVNKKYVKLQKERTRNQFFGTGKVDLSKVRKVIRESSKE
jgi:DNA modification methylase